MSNSLLVLAEQYELQAKTTRNGMQVYDVNGQKKLLKAKKLVARAWVDRNNVEENRDVNNCFYQTYESETAKLFNEKIEEAEVVEDLQLSEGINYESMNKEELQNLCDERGIEFHHKAGKSKLIELLSE